MDEKRTGPDGLETTSVSEGMDGWDDISWGEADQGADPFEMSEDSPENEEDASEPEEDAGGGENQPEAEKTAAETEAQESAAAAGSFPLKHLGETRNASREEVMSLAQKGLDYDRIRQERDALKAAGNEYKSFLEELSKAQNTDINALMDNTRARLLADSEKRAGRELSESEALRRVISERLGRAAAPKAPESREEPAPDNKALERLAKAFPEVKAEDIPKSIWDGVREGGDLTALFAMHQNQELRQRIAALEQNEKNRQRSTGSRQTAGNRGGKSTIEELWNADD